MEFIDDKNRIINLNPLTPSAIANRWETNSPFRNPNTDLYTPKHIDAQTWILIHAGLPRPSATSLSTNVRDLLVMDLLGWNHPFYSILLRNINYATPDIIPDTHSLIDVLAHPENIVGQAGVKFIKQVLSRYTPPQWIKVQDNCWYIGKADTGNTSEETYLRDCYYLTPEERQHFDYDKAIKKSAEEAAMYVQKAQGVYWPTTAEESLPKYFRLNNLTRPFVARKTAIIFSKTLLEIKDPKTKRSFLLGNFLDADNQFLTLQKLNKEL